MNMISSFTDLLNQLSPVMTAQTFQNFLIIMTGWLFAGRRTITGMGAGPSVPALGGLVLDLDKPIKYLGTAVADSSGEVVKRVFVSDNIGVDRFFVQALAVRGVDGSDSLKSNPIPVKINSH